MKGMNGVIGGKEAPVFRHVGRNPKFQQEKVCRETEAYLVHFDGILLNHARPAGENERFDLLTGLYERFGAEMTAHLKGQYNLVLWDKRRQKALVANDLLSKRSLYYCMHLDQLYYAASFHDLLDLLSAANYPAHISAQAVQAMARGGSLPENLTYLEGVHYLDAFKSLEFDLSTGALRTVSITPKSAYSASSTENAIHIFDQLFTAAVRAQFDKNAEYGCRHYVALSGGMDSRSCLLKAVQCGYTQNLTCFNYSQSGSIDNSVSRRIAIDHHLDYLHYPMDAAVFMTRLDDAAACNEGQQSCIGSTGARTMARLLDKTEAGIVHVGLCGGELMGDLVEPAHPAGRLQRVLERLGMASAAGRGCRFKTREYLNNIRACQNFSHMFLAECETVSPFLDEDVVQFILSVDPALLYRRNLYREWMKKYIPNAYPTTMFCGPITISPAQEVLRKIADRLVRRIAGTSRRDMNPFDHWLSTQPQLLQLCEQAYQSGMIWLEKQSLSSDLLQPIVQAWRQKGEARFFALTAVMALKDVLSRFKS